MALKRSLINIVDFFIFGNFFIAVCAVAMFGYTVRLYSLNVPSELTFFIFFSTLASYSLHWYLTPDSTEVSGKSAWSLAHKKFLILLFIFSSAGAAICFWHISAMYKYIIPLALITFLYSAPKIEAAPFIWLRGKYLAKTITLSVVWVAVTAALPFVVSGTALSGDPFWFLLNRFMLIFPICVLFDHRDRAEDLKEGIKNIVSIMNEKKMNILFWTCTVLAIISAIVLQLKKPDYLNTLILLAPTILLAFTYRKSKETKSDVWFYAYLDGLMALGGFLYFLLHI